MGDDGTTIRRTPATPGDETSKPPGRGQPVPHADQTAASVANSQLTPAQRAGRLKPAPTRTTLQDKRPAPSQSTTQPGQSFATGAATSVKQVRPQVNINEKISTLTNKIIELDKEIVELKQTVESTKDDTGKGIAKGMLDRKIDQKQKLESELEVLKKQIPSPTTSEETKKEEPTKTRQNFGLAGHRKFTPVSPEQLQQMREPKQENAALPTAETPTTSIASTESPLSTSAASSRTRQESLARARTFSQRRPSSATTSQVRGQMDISKSKIDGIERDASGKIVKIDGKKLNLSKVSPETFEAIIRQVEKQAQDELKNPKTDETPKLRVALVWQECDFLTELAAAAKSSGNMRNMEAIAEAAGRLLQVNELQQLSQIEAGSGTKIVPQLEGIIFFHQSNAKATVESESLRVLQQIESGKVGNKDAQKRLIQETLSIARELLSKGNAMQAGKLIDALHENKKLEKMIQKDEMLQAELKDLFLSSEPEMQATLMELTSNNLRESVTGIKIFCYFQLLSEVSNAEALLKENLRELADTVTPDRKQEIERQNPILQKRIEAGNSFINILEKEMRNLTNKTAREDITKELKEKYGKDPAPQGILSNRIVAYIYNDVLTEERANTKNLDECADAISRWMVLAIASNKQGDYVTAQAIQGALTKSAIYRLKKTSERIPESIKNEFNNLKIPTFTETVEQAERGDYTVPNLAMPKGDIVKALSGGHVLPAQDVLKKIELCTKTSEEKYLEKSRNLLPPTPKGNEILKTDPLIVDTSKKRDDEKVFTERSLQLEPRETKK